MRHYLLTTIALVLINFVFYPSQALAHCDGIDGPVVLAAEEALKTGNVNLILTWVQETEEEVTYPTAILIGGYIKLKVNK